MRKTIFIFLIIITSFIFIDNVYASVEESTTINYKLEVINYNDLSDEEKENLIYTYNNGSATATIGERFELLIDYFNDQTKYDSYVIFSGSNSGYGGLMYMYNKDNTIDTLFLSKTSAYFYFHFLSNDYDSSYYYINFGKVSGSSIPSNWKITNQTYNNNTYTNIKLNSLFSSTTTFSPTKIYFASNHIEKVQFTSELKIESNDTSTKYNNVYYNNELLFSNGSFAYSKTPTINFNNLIHSYNDNNEIISTSIDIILNNIDTSKHLAQYTTQSSIDYNLANGGIETWEDIVIEEDKTFTTNINDTLYVRIIDAEKYWESADNSEELVIDIIKSATYTFTNIVETLPTIQYSTRIPDICKIIHNDTDYISCVELSMNVKNMNVNKYKLYRMEHYTDTDIYTEWSECYYTEFKNYINDNMTIFYKVTDKYDNYITSVSIKIESIRNFLEQGLFIEFSDKYLKNSRLVEITMKIANDNNYTYYYSTNNGLEYKVVQDITDINFNIKKGIIYTDTNGKILVKVVDSNGQVVNIFEHTINYKQLQMNNDSFGSHINSVFNFFITPITHIFSLITTFYSTLPTILQYLFSGIFILAIFYYIIKFIL